MRNLYGSTVMKSNHTSATINYYKVLDEKYGIEIEKQVYNEEIESKKIPNITENIETINKVLDILTEKFVMPESAEYIIEDMKFENLIS